MGSKGVVWRPIATIAAAVGDVELEDQVLRLSRYLGYAKVLLNNFYFLGGGPALKNKPCLNLAVLEYPRVQYPECMYELDV